MLSLTTKRHHVLVCFPGLMGSYADNFDGYGESVDDAIDRLLAKCQQDDNMQNLLMQCSTRAEAYQQIAKHLKAATPDGAWRSIAGDLCRRVLFLLQPNRFGFEKYGWIY